MGVGKMIRKARERKRFSQLELAKRIGVSDKTVSAWEKERTTPNEEMLGALMSVLGVDANYLFEIDHSFFEISQEERGLIWKARQLKDWQLSMIHTVIDQLIDHNDTDSEAFRLIEKPYYYSRPSAGYGNEIFEESGTIRVKDTQAAEKADFVLQVDGKSMEPEFKDGEFLLVKSCDDIDEGEIGIFFVDGVMYVKKKGKSELKSLNPRFPNVYLNEFSQIKCYGKVIGKADI